jgi:hypothetical protein
MLDKAHYSQKVSRTLADCERKKLTAVVEFRICYRNSIPKRGTIRLKFEKVLNLGPVDSPPFPDEIFSALETLIPHEPNVPNADSEISVTYSFFLGTVVDMRREIVQHC